MADESFKYPPGIQPVEHWQQVEAAWGGIERSTIEAIQKDAIMAARREQAPIAGEDLQDVDPRNPKGI